VTCSHAWWIASHSHGAGGGEEAYFIEIVVANIFLKQHSQERLIEPLQQSMQQLQQRCNRGSSLQAHWAAVHLNVLVNNAWIFNA
jgi:hypothetical protein